MRRVSWGANAAAAWLLVGAVWTNAASAQVDYFGQNKIQYRDFEWRVLRSAHVDLYYYPEADELARVALGYAEESFAYLEQKFGHTPPARIPLIIYASHTDFEQTNILPFVPPEGLLGVTEFLKRRVTLPFTGNYADFRHTLRHELVHAFQLSILTETYERHPRQSHPPLPLWWTEGLAEFWSAGEDGRDEMILRDLTIAGRLPPLEPLTYATGGLVYPLGGALHRWLADRFGEWRVQVMYREVWKYRTFDEAVLAVYGVSLERLSSEYLFAFRQRYYPAVVTRRPLDITARRLAQLAIKPVAYQLPGDSTTKLLFLSPASGYMSIYASDADRLGGQRIEVQGERTAEFESFHTFSSRMDVRSGIAVFTSKYQERDALFFWNLRKHAVVGRYQFPHLVSLLSPNWAPDGRSVVFSALTLAGYSDLYRLWLADGRLEQLTHDRYEDLDPSVSPDGRHVVFTSDRTAFGPAGARNLFLLDLTDGAVRYLTYGNWQDETPRWASNGRIYFSSDRDTVFDIYSVDSIGQGRRETRTFDGAFDPEWLPGTGGLLFSGFSELTFDVFRARPDVDTLGTGSGAFALASDTAATGWPWPELTDGRYLTSAPAPYQQRFSLDFAAGDALVAPGAGTAQGAVFAFSDLLSDHLLYASVTSSQGSGIDGFVDSFNGSIFYLNQKRRLNWGAGVFRLRGLFYENDLLTTYDETSWGGFAELRWPFSRFSRVEGELSLEHSDRFDLAGGDFDEPHRVGWLASNFVAVVHDNALWLPTGPIDGDRINVTAGVTNDLSNGRFDAWTVAADYRRYLRLGQQSAVALRFLGYYADGSRPRQLSIGGTWGLRGYPRIGGVAGTRVALVNTELRFPLADLSIGFPFGELRFAGIQGALFADLGGAGTATTVNRGLLGSGGLGLRLPFGPLVLRLDLGERFELGNVSGYPISGAVGRKFADFFFGYNY